MAGSHPVRSHGDEARTHLPAGSTGAELVAEPGLPESLRCEPGPLSNSTALSPSHETLGQGLLPSLYKNTGTEQLGQRHTAGGCLSWVPSAPSLLCCPGCEERKGVAEAESRPFSSQGRLCVMGCQGRKARAWGEGRGTVEVFMRLGPPGRPPGPGSPEPWHLASLAGREPRKRWAVVFSWVMGHHDSFNFRNPI